MSTPQKKSNRPSIRALLDPSEQPAPSQNVTDKGIEQIREASEALSVEDTEFDDSEDVTVPGVIPANVKPLQSSSKVGVIPRYQQALDEFIQARGEQRSARFTFKELGDEGAKKLAGLLSSGTARSLEGLDISCNSINVAGCQSIARSLTANTVLRALDFSANAIGDAGATALADSLRLNVTLQHLDLHACDIRDPGAKALADVLLNGNGCLVALNLKANYIGDLGATSLAAAIRRNKALRCVVTASNDIGRAGQAELERAMEANPDVASSTAAGAHDGIVGEVCVIA